MQAAQQRFWPDPQPLVERLGRDFFRSLPERPGVYLMRDAGETVLYVGKAKNLRKRLGSYRVANPERMPRRFLRLLHRVIRIDLETCADETAALARESELLRLLQPRFNRAGVWPAPLRFLAWRTMAAQLELALVERLEPGWQWHGPLKGGTRTVRAALVRLLWCGIHPDKSLTGMPPGWFYGKLPETLSIGLTSDESADEVVERLAALVTGVLEPFRAWIETRMSVSPPCQRIVLEEDWECVARYFTAKHPAPARSPQDGSGEFEACWWKTSFFTWPA